MQIEILTMGSRGDVQPFIALGVGLQQAGYAVKLATHANFETMIRDRGLEFVPLPDDWSNCDYMTGYWFLDRASQLGEQIRSENGVARTVEIVRETIQLR